jgi:hypothetical protein
MDVFVAWYLVKHRDNFTFKREEMAEGCRKLYNEELHNLCVSESIIRVSK